MLHQKQMAFVGIYNLPNLPIDVHANEVCHVQSLLL